VVDPPVVEPPVVEPPVVKEPVVLLALEEVRAVPLPPHPMAIASSPAKQAEKNSSTLRLRSLKLLNCSSVIPLEITAGRYTLYNNQSWFRSFEQ
jgi:hypothetical protein